MNDRDLSGALLGASITPSGFDRSKHVAPRLTNKGLNMVMTADKMAKSLTNQSRLFEGSKVPDWWTKANMQNAVASSGFQTKTELVNRRRSDRLPHASFDLDGDGVVGTRDYRVAKLYDKEQKGRLTDEQRKEAIQAMHAVSLTWLL